MIRDPLDPFHPDPFHDVDPDGEAHGRSVIDRDIQRGGGPSVAFLALGLALAALIAVARLAACLETLDPPETTMRYGTGWRPNVILDEGTLAPPRMGAIPLPSAWDRIASHVGGGFPMRNPLALPTLDQSNTERCVSYSGAEIIYGRLAELGEKPVLVNIRIAHALAQRTEQEREGAERRPITNEGLYPIDFLDACATHGVVACRGPDDPELAPERLGDELWGDEVRDAATHLVTGWRRVPSDGELAVLAIKQALYAGFPAMDGLDLDARFFDYKAGVYVRDPRAPSAGRHMTSTWGWDDRARCSDGTRGAFLKLNHYDESFGMRGWFWLAYSTYGDGRLVSDRTYLDAAPKGL